MTIQSAAWLQVGDGCWVRRYPEYDVNVGVVAGSDGLLVIDTRGSLRQGESLRDNVRRLHPAPIRAVVNTHVHFDHTFGNAAFVADVGGEINAHAQAADALAAHAEAVKLRCREHPDGDPEYPSVTADVMRDMLATPIVVPSRTVTVERHIDLGDRGVDLRYLGRGHTDGDLVVVADGGAVVFAGDLVEESGDPSYGADSFPLDWPVTLDALLAQSDDSTVTVPGHGSPVGRDFVRAQAAAVAAVATTIRALHAAGASLADALAHRDWPYEPQSLADAVRRGYAVLDAPV